MKKFKIINKETQIHEFDIEIDDIDKGTIYHLKASNGGEWSEHIKGEKFVSILDHGNGIRVNSYDSNFKGKVKTEWDYSFENELRILLNFKNNYESRPQHYEVLGGPLFEV